MIELKPVLEILKTLGSYVGVLYVFGFLVVRARLTALGVWTGLPILDASYLAEGAVFVAWTIWVLLKPIGIWVVFIAALLFFLRLALGARLEPRIAKLRAGLPALQVLLVVLVYGLALLSARPAFSVGGLLLSEEKPPTAQSYDSLVLWIAVTAALWYWLRTTALTPTVFRHLTGALTFALVAVPLPITYAIDRRCSDFPVATISFEDATQSVVGWLIYESAEQVVVFDPALKSMRTLARKNVKEIAVQRYARFP